jgi:amino acid adenylation domain-containing protein
MSFFCVATAEQEAVFFAQQADVRSTAYNYPLSWRFTGQAVGRQATVEAFRSVIARHVPLRAAFRVNCDSGRVEMMERPVEDVQIEQYDLTACSVSNQTEDILLDQHLIRLAGMPIDLKEQSSVYAIFVVKPTDIILFANFHHIIIDGYSLPVMIRDLVSALNGEDFNPPQLETPYNKYATWENKRLQDSEYTRCKLEFWKEMLKDVPSRIQFPVFKQHSKQPTQNLSTMSERVSGLVNKLALTCKVTPFVVLFTTFSLLVGRLCNMKHFLVGTATLNRLRPDFKHTVGFFSRLAAVPVDMRDEPTFTILAKRIMNLFGQILKYQDIPLSMITKELDPHHQTHRGNLIQCMMAYEGRVPADTVIHITNQETQLQFEYVAKPDNQVDLGVEVSFNNRQYRFKWEYSTEFFSYRFISQLGERMNAIIENASDNDTVSVSHLPITLGDETEKLLKEWQGEDLDFTDSSTVHSLVEKQSMLTPHMPAVQYKSLTMTYSQLIQRATCMAEAIQAELSHDAPYVGILHNRSMELVTIILAVLKAGAAYVPLSTDFPKRRLFRILKETQCSLVITQTCYSHLLINFTGNLMLTDKPFQTPSKPETNFRSQPLAYILYTSGSTGKPKGVACSHSSLVNVLSYMRWKYWDNCKDVLSKTMFSTNICFDAHCEEVFLPLISGGCVVVVDNILAPEEGVTYISGTPSALAVIPIPSSVKACVLGGEPMSMACWRNLHHIPMILNTYGPTECTVECTTTLVQHNQISCIGRPIANVKVYVLDERMQLVPPGIQGELYVGGVCVSEGYVNQPALMLVKFLDNPFGEGKLYKTGDLVRWLNDGNLEFISRADNQVKIRGMRVELGEIEQQLMAQPDIQQAFVTMTKHSANQQLAAYIAPNTVKIDTVKKSLEDTLPSYMIPTMFCLLERLPLSIQNKVDESALPPLQPHTAAPLNSKQIPQDLNPGVFAKAERIILYYKSIFGVDGDVIHLDSNFFHLGGHSLLAMRLLYEIQDKEEIHLSIHDVLRNPSPRQLALRLHSLKPPKIPEILRKSLCHYCTPIKPFLPFPLSLMQQRLAKLHEQHLGSPVLNMTFAFQFKSDAHKPEQLIIAIKDVVNHHTALRTLFQPDKDGKLQQYYRPFKIADIDFKEINNSDLHQELTNLSEKPCDLSTDLFKCTVLNTGNAAEPNLIIHIRSHHIIMDGYSTSLFHREIPCFLTKQGIEDNPVQFHEYCRWQADQMMAGAMDEQLQFWKKYLKSSSFRTALPYQIGIRSVNLSCHGGQMIVAASTEVRKEVKHLSGKTSTSESIILLTALGIAIASFTVCSDVIVGYRVANRQLETARAIGCYYNVLPIRFQLKPADTYTDCLHRTIQDLNSMTQNADVTFLQIAEAFKLDTADLFTSVCQVTFNYEAYKLVDTATSIKISPICINHSQILTVSDIALDVSGTIDGYCLRWTYNVDKLSRDSIVVLTGQFNAVLGRMLENPKQVIGVQNL